MEASSPPAKKEAAEGVQFKTSIKVYENHAIFKQDFLSGANSTSVGDRDKTISSFPTFVPAWKEAKGFLSFHGSHQGASENTMGLSWIIMESCCIALNIFKAFITDRQL